METLVERAFSGAGPCAVGALGQHRAAAAAQAQAHLHRLRIGRRDAETGIALRIDLRKGLPRLVELKTA